MGLALPLCPRSAFCLTGVLPSASRPCRPHFFVAPHSATPNNKKRLPFGNLLLLLERAMGLALPLRSRSAFCLTGVLPSASRPCRLHDINLGNSKNQPKCGCYGHFITLILRIFVCFRTL